jgi:hypothetical protein
MAAGGVAPISRSRTMPPEFAATKDSTSTPKISSLRLTPAVAPLRANTKVPTRSRVRTSVLRAAATSRETAGNILMSLLELERGRTL